MLGAGRGRRTTARWSGPRCDHGSPRAGVWGRSRHQTEVKDSGIGRSAQADSSCTLSVSTCCCIEMTLPSRNVQTCAICTSAGLPVERCFHE